MPFGNKKSPGPSRGGFGDDDAAGDDGGSKAVGGDGNDVDDGKETLTQEAETKEINGSEGTRPLDDETNEELDLVAPNGVAGNKNPNEKGPLLAAAEFPKPAEAAPKPMLARPEESAGAEALCPP